MSPSLLKTPRPPPPGGPLPRPLFPRRASSRSRVCNGAVLDTKPSCQGEAGVCMGIMGLGDQQQQQQNSSKSDKDLGAPAHLTALLVDLLQFLLYARYVEDSSHCCPFCAQDRGLLLPLLQRLWCAEQGGNSECMTGKHHVTSWAEVGGGNTSGKGPSLHSLSLSVVQVLGCCLPSHTDRAGHHQAPGPARTPA